MRDLKKYTDKSSIYRKGTPIHVKGSLIYNQMVAERKMQNKYPFIIDGDKIKFSYLLKPNPARDTVISCPGALPKEMELDKYIDYDMQFDKAFLEPIRSILDVIGWRTEYSTRATLEDFFQ